MSQSQLNAIVIRITLEGPNYPEWLSAWKLHYEVMVYCII